VVLNAFHVPLVDQNNDLFAWFAGFVYFFKELIVFLIDKNLFEFREENISTLNVPIHHVLVQTFL